MLQQYEIRVCLEHLLSFYCTIVQYFSKVHPSTFILHTTQTIGKKVFMMQSHAESMKKILGALQDLPANQHSQSSPIPQIMTESAVLVSWQILHGSQDFLHIFSMVLQYHKWGVKTGFTFALQFSRLFLTVQVV